jgi:hypothetical protein
MRVVHVESEGRDGTYRVVDSSTGERIMCGLSSRQSATWWARGEGLTIVEAPTSPGFRLASLEFRAGKVITYWRCVV